MWYALTAGCNYSQPMSLFGWLHGWYVGGHAADLLWPSGEKYAVGLNRGHMKMPMGFRLAPHHRIWYWMTPRGQRSTSKSFDSKYLENGSSYEVGPLWTLICRTHGLSVGIVRFDFGWPWEVKNKGQIFDVKYVKNGNSHDRCWAQRRLYRVPMGFTSNDLERSKSKVTILWFLKTMTDTKLDPQGVLFQKQSWAFDWYSQIWPWMTLNGQKPKSQFLIWNMWRAVRVAMLDPMELLRVPIGLTLDDLERLKVSERWW